MKVVRTMILMVTAFLYTNGALGACKVGPDENLYHHPITVEESDGTYVIKAVKAGDDKYIGVFVTEPSAVLPKGPKGQLNGKNYWSASIAKFPLAFRGPITYGVAPKGSIDSSATYGAIQGGVPLNEIDPGTCLKFSVVNFPSFKTTSFHVLTK